MGKARSTSSISNAIGYEAQLWQMADALRGSMDAAENKHVVLDLIFLKCISDAFVEHHARLVVDEKGGAQRWQYDAPPAGNANYAWVQHFIHHLAPIGLAGIVLANGSPLCRGDGSTG